MPIYEYRCQECKTSYEVLAATSTPTAEETACVKCGSQKVRKTISAGSFRLAGGGPNIPAGALSGCSSKGGFS